MSNATNSQQRFADLPADLVHLLPDYLNGHLGGADLAEFEAQLADNTALQEQLQFERALQAAMRAQARAADENAAIARVPSGTGFAAIADRLEQAPQAGWLVRLQRWWQGPRLHSGVPAFALLLVVGLVGATSLVTPTDPVNEFETLTAVESASQPTLRVLPKIAVESPEFLQLLADYGLQLEQTLPGSNMADATLILADADLARIAAAVANDERVVRVKVVGQSTGDGGRATDSARSATDSAPR